MKHPIIQAQLLRGGDLIHLGGTNYALVAKSVPTGDGGVEVTLYAGDRPANHPALSYLADDEVGLAARDLDPDQPIVPSRQENLLAAALDRDIAAAAGRMRAAVNDLDRAVTRLRALGEQITTSDAGSPMRASQAIVQIAGELTALRKARSYLTRNGG